MVHNPARLAWASLPAEVHGFVDEMLGSRVVDALDVTGGYSPAPTARCDLGDGRRVFVKVAGESINAQSVEFHRAEVATLAALPAEVPAARLVAHAEATTEDETRWIALATEWLDGRTPREPMTNHDVQRIAALIDRLPSRADEPLRTSLPLTVDKYSSWDRTWRSLADQPTRTERLDPAVAGSLDRLVELERGVLDAIDGPGLAHGDVRADNVILGDQPADDRLIDWAHASIGNRQLDTVAMLPAHHIDGGVPPWELDTRLGIVDDRLVPILVGVLGYFVAASLQEPIATLPGLRELQAAQGNVTWEWLRHRW